jgi:hypothetical protein
MTREPRPGAGAAILSSIILGLLVVAAIISCMFAFPAYGRYQTLANERNQVTVNDIQIQQTEQLVQVEKQKAQIKIQEALGIAQAQRIINGTLTPQYLQHEAIQAQLTAAENSSHTETIYVPSGPQGIPMVFGAHGRAVTP